METVLSPPQPFRFDENSIDIASGKLSDSWKKWKRGFAIYFEACELNKKSTIIQLNILLHIIGEQCREIVEQSKEMTIDGVWKKLDEYFEIKRNVTVERHKFFTRSQQQSESIEQYVFDLRKLAQTCEFGELRDDLIKDRLVCGIYNSAIRERLLREDDLTLPKAMEIYQAAIVSKMYSENIRPENDVHSVQEEKNRDDSNDVCAIKKLTKVTPSFSRAANQTPWAMRGRNEQDRRNVTWRGISQQYTRSQLSNSTQPMKGSYSIKECKNCGTGHAYGACPAYGKTCLRCLRRNHFARVCRVYVVDASSDQQVIRSINKDLGNWTVDLKICNNIINFKLDTGADVNVLPLRYLQILNIFQGELLKTNSRLSGYSGASIKVVGKIYLKVHYKNNLYLLEFTVADVESMPVLSRYACVELGLIQRVLSVQRSEGTIPEIIGESYLLLVDYFSKFFELVKLRSTLSYVIINCLKDIFSRQGIPTIVMSDCGPQFSAYEFKKFAQEWNFFHITSSPHYPQSNGQIERTVQTVKNIIKKSAEDNVDYRLALLEYLNTPLTNNLPSPAELLQSRKMRSIVPTPFKLLKPKVHTDTRNKLISRQQQQKIYYDQGSRNLSILNRYDKVRVYDTIKKIWVSGVVESYLGNRSYRIRLTNGLVVVRNRRHLRTDLSYIQNTPQDHSFDYDHILPHHCNEASNQQTSSNFYVTRFGRMVRPPDRWDPS
ncbi:hypothetical protein ACJJTC_007136 [Scirpophaga incertulas]